MRIWFFVQPLVVIAPKYEVIIGVPQASVAVAAPGLGTLLGLQPKLAPGGQYVKDGGVTSTVQVNTCVQVAVLPHASVAVYVRTWLLRHPFDATAPNAEVMVGALHPSVAVAAPGGGI